MSRSGPRRILVVDDEENLLKLVSHVLAREGYALDVARDGWSAIAIAAERPPDLVVLDLMMPELDGWGVLARLRERGPLPSVLLLTARSDYATFVRAVRGGVTAFLGKPFRLQELLQACRKILSAPELEPEPGQERRLHPRRRLLLEVEVFSHQREPMTFGEIVDLSPVGARLELDAPLGEGDRIRIGFHPRGGSPSALCVECSVLWWRAYPGTRVAHGLSFCDLSPEQELRLAELFLPPA